MPSSYTTSLRLTLPATGELAGQWGSTVNTGITELLDAAVAGTTVISTWGGAGVPYTLSNNSGAADEARKMFLVATGTPGEAKNVICPAVSKLYVFRNDTTGGFALTLKTSGGTGIAVPAGQYKMLYCDGTNVVEAVNSAGALTLSGALSVGGTTTLASNPTLSAGTANGVLYLNGSKVATSGSALIFDGANFGLGAATPTAIYGKTLQIASGATEGSLSIVGPTGAVFLATVGATGQLIARGGSSLVLGANDTEQMRLTSTGLGIGTSSPTDKLDVLVAPATTAASGLKVRTASITAQLAVTGASYNNYGVGANTVWLFSDTNNLALGPYGGAGVVQFVTGGSEKMRLDSSGNLGLGVTPSAWQTAVRAFDIAGGSNAGALYSGAGVNLGAIANGYYLSGIFYYKTTAAASDYRQESGAHKWLTAPSGTAGNAISFTQAMTLDASGNLLVGTTTANAKVKLALTSPGTLGTVVNVGSFGSSGVLSLGGATNNTDGVYLGTGDTGGIGVASGIGFLREAIGWNSALAFYTNNVTSGPNGTSAITERARITSDGVLCVGYQGVAEGATPLQIDANSTGSTQYVARFANSSTSTSVYNVARWLQGAAGSAVGMIGTGGSAVSNTGFQNTFVVGTQTSNALVFATADTERARITSGGDFLVGTMAQIGSEKFGVDSGSGACGKFKGGTSANVTVDAWNPATTGDNIFVAFRTETAETTRGTIDYNRAGGLVRYNTTSDYRAKDIIGPVQNPGATIDALKVYEGRMKGATQSRPMLIAHEAQEHAPYAVSGVKDEVNEDGTPKFQQMDVSSLVPLLLAEIQSLRARVAALEAQP